MKMITCERRQEVCLNRVMCQAVYRMGNTELRNSIIRDESNIYRRDHRLEAVEFLHT